jgi:hypothetical protein
MKRPILVAALAATLPGTGCIGPNHAFRGVHSWNTRATDSKWWNELLHIGMWIIPVYELTLAGDILIFNSIEFWGGNNPINEPDPPQPVKNGS